MSVSAGANYSYSVVPGTSVVDKRAATIEAQGATVVVANWGLTSDTKTEDTVNLKSDLSQANATTPTSKLTTGLAKLLQTASHLDSDTGAREINQGAGEALGRELGKLLVGSGFSTSDALDASSSLVKQFTSAISGSDVIALSLSGQAQTAGSYKASVSGGIETSAYSVQSTSKLNLTFNTATGDISLKLDQHKVAATRIEWSSSVASNVSISLSDSELEAIGFSPIGTSQNNTGSPVHESQTTTLQSAPESGVGSSNLSGPDALARYLDFEKNVVQGGGAATVAATSVANKPGTLSSGTNKTQSSAELALTALKQIVAQAKASNAQHNHTVGISIVQKLGTAITDTKGDKHLVFSRPNGETGSVDFTGVSVKA